MSCHRSRIDDEDMISYINEKIRVYWSPEQISNRRTDQIKKLPSTSTIYRMIHRKQLNKIQMINLRRQGKFKRPAEKRGKFNDGGRTLKKRPKEIFKRDELSHWEGDTVESGRIDHKRKSKYCFVTLVERKSRMYIAILVPNRNGEPDKRYSNNYRLPVMKYGGIILEYEKAKQIIIQFSSFEKAKNFVEKFDKYKRNK